MVSCQADILRIIIVVPCVKSNRVKESKCSEVAEDEDESETRSRSPSFVDFI